MYGENIDSSINQSRPSSSPISNDQLFFRGRFATGFLRVAPRRPTFSGVGERVAFRMAQPAFGIKGCCAWRSPPRHVAAAPRRRSPPSACGRSAWRSPPRHGAARLGMWPLRMAQPAFGMAQPARHVAPHGAARLRHVAAPHGAARLRHVAERGDRNDNRSLSFRHSFSLGAFFHHPPPPLPPCSIHHRQSHLMSQLPDCVTTAYTNSIRWFSRRVHPPLEVVPNGSLSLVTDLVSITTNCLLGIYCLTQ